MAACRPRRVANCTCWMVTLSTAAADTTRSRAAAYTQPSVPSPSSSPHAMPLTQIGSVVLVLVLLIIQFAAMIW